MLSKQVYTEHVVSLSELFPSFTQQFLKPFNKLKDAELSSEMLLDFKISERINHHKINPILRLARPEDAEEITEIYRELYNGTYPYKEMEDVNEVRKLIKHPNVQWIIYQDPTYNIAGCITFVLNFENKRGYIRGFMLKKKYQGYLDITKAMIGSMLGMIHKYKNKIYVWYVENRTAHSKSQYSMWVCGIAPIGFYPNKDVFLGKVESDLMQVLYDERALTRYRKENVPQIIPEVENCYLYADKRYKLGEYQIREPKISLNQKKIYRLKNAIQKNVTKDEFGYEKYRFTFPNTDSYFEFLYTPQVKNFENTLFYVNNLEELYVFLKEFIQCGMELEIRYCEVFISAYNLAHQKLFSEAGLSPRGYIPSWRYNNKSNVFEDNILFNWFKGEISSNIQLIDEGKHLLEILDLTKREELSNITEDRFIIKRLPTFYSFKEKVSNIWNYPKMVKSSLLIGLAVYLSMIIASLVIANSFGYKIDSHTISQLGSFHITPMPFIFDCASIIGGITTILLYCYLSRRITVEKEIMANKISRYGAIVGNVGSIGIMSVGIFSLDRSGPFGAFHFISTIVAFGGFIVALLTFGILLYKMNSTLNKAIGINGIVPLIILLGNIFFPSPLMEWFLLFTILTSLIPLFCWVTYN
jgi:hypothetical protein